MRQMEERVREEVEERVREEVAERVRVEVEERVRARMEERVAREVEDRERRRRAQGDRRDGEQSTRGPKRKEWEELGESGKKKCAAGVESKLKELAEERNVEPHKIAAHIIKRCSAVHPAL